MRGKWYNLNLNRSFLFYLDSAISKYGVYAYLPEMQGSTVLTY